MPMEPRKSGSHFRRLCSEQRLGPALPPAFGRPPGAVSPAWSALKAFVERLGGVLCRLWYCLGRLGPIVGRLGCLLDHFGCVLGLSGGPWRGGVSACGPPPTDLMGGFPDVIL